MPHSISISRRPFSNARWALFKAAYSTVIPGSFLSLRSIFDFESRDFFVPLVVA